MARDVLAVKMSQLSLLAESMKGQQPLAERMRPQNLDDILGQDEAIGPDSPFGMILRRKDIAIPSVILWGPPGTGKTTIAQVIAATSGQRFVRLSGVLDGVAELRQAVKKAEEALHLEGRKTLALVDEIHRFNKAQQDAFLPHVELGTLTVIGQTTDNVSFRIRNALLSRLRVIEVKPLGVEVVCELLHRAMNDTERGLGKWGIELEEAAASYLASTAGGDVRRALTGLEWSAAVARTRKLKSISQGICEEAFGSQPQLFDSDGEYHYDCTSAFIKSLRGSDPDAALYYMVRALDGGEDPLFITRRMIIFASEDAACDPRALEIAINVDLAVQRIGMPEGRIALAHAATYLASCPKSNASYKALREMEQVVRSNPNLEVPKRLRNAPTELMRELGNSQGYRYPHDYEDAFVPERYLPTEISDLRVYKPSERGVEQAISARLRRLEEQIKAQKSSLERED